MPKKKSVAFTLDFNPAFKRAFSLMEDTTKHVFVTGRAGTGKSTLLSYFRDHTKKNIVVLAPTGVAAVNVRGQTIHSFFGFKPHVTLAKVRRMKEVEGEENIYQALDAIVIDEVSMVRADLLDCIDKFLRLNGRDDRLPFGGVQMIMIGDLYQLPPVVTRDEQEIFSRHYATPYFFSAHVFSPQKKLLHDDNDFLLELVELETIYRQRDPAFIALLNSIRNNTVGEVELSTLNSRYSPLHERQADDTAIYLMTTNAMANEMNTIELQKLPEELRSFTGERSGDFEDTYLPTDPDLAIKIGAQVMLLNNDPDARWINGTIGQVISFEPSYEAHSELINVELTTGDIVAVAPHRWDIYRFHYDEKIKRIDAESVGSFTQYPLRLAWAVTIHKSQGKTFDRVIVDIGRGTFSPGQLYVALSRCTTFEGIILKRQIRKEHIWTDERVVAFMTGVQYVQAEATMSLKEKVALIEGVIDSGEKLAITYLKAEDSKSKRVIIPHEVGEMEYQGQTYVGVSAYCLEMKANRIFRVDRILSMEVIASE